MADSSAPNPGTQPGLNRQIGTLAVPALGALLAEPAFLLADTAIIGHLGTAELAGVAVASVVLTTIVGLAVFLAYATTAQVSRSLGAGDLKAALRYGIDGLYLAIGLGVVAAALCYPLASPLISAIGASASETPFGVTYFRWSLLGLPGMLLVLAATGVLRGLQDMTTPLLVAVTGAVANVGLNLALVYGVGWGVAGAAIGTVTCQTGMALWLVLVVRRGARRHRVSMRPELRGMRGVGAAGVPLVIRTASLRAAIILATMVAARLGTESLAGHQIVMSLWNFLALGLDAVAIAAQALTGKALGAGDRAAVRALTRRMLWWGVGAGAVLGVAVFAVHGLAGGLFTSDPAVRAVIIPALVILAVAQPLSGWVFVLDGVLIGAGDLRYLAWAGVANVIVFAPAAWAVAHYAGMTASAPGASHTEGWVSASWFGGLGWLWIAYAGAYMAARAVTLGVRYRTDRWLVTGPHARSAKAEPMT